ncbi:MAG: single-stranded-DNA-specific exonuclease RecJ [Lachnospiraceae bacterium]|nr:single-stranded-DNA-specific exonuclease RecJ [Ruminococcus sp.]MCM1274256.1 single-stranded-DNA-specific exonuclease RecJ [Lachnospiraceae bacterium]
MKQWILPTVVAAENNEIKSEFGDFLGEILIRRGIVTLDGARAFFGCDRLSDPMLMSDMPQAVEMVRSALDEDKRITVFGDYDCDGVCSTVMLYSYLEAQGADVDFYIPDRSEGFGMSVGALEKIAANGTQLVITVDNGISAVKEAEFLKSKGIDLLITDHHQPNASLPECGACVDPNRADDPSPFKDLCGAGVVLKLLMALEEDEDFVTESYADLAAVATVGDVVPLKGENRYIVRLGLDNIRNEQNAGLTALIKSARRRTDNITSTDLAFTVCPRINAAGRMAHAEKAARLLLCEDDAETAGRLAEETELLNNNRKTAESKILEDVQKQLAENPMILKQRVIVLAGEGWHRGVIGIVCSSLLEKYDKPVVMISVENGEARGSVRSIEGFSVHKMLMECSAPLTTFGGHPKAGGFSLPADRVGELTELIYKYARENHPKMPTAVITADIETTCAAVTVDNVRLLSKLEPFGERNAVPNILLKNCTVKAKRPMKDGKYTSFDAESGGVTLRVITFKIPFGSFLPNVGDRIDMIATASINEYNGKESAELMLVDYRPAGFPEGKFLAAARTYEEICRGEDCDKHLEPRILPQSREELIKIYEMVKKSGGKRTAEELATFDGSVNYCKLRITLDAFAEAKMIELDENCAPKILPVTEKRDLFASGLLSELKKRFSKETIRG